MGPHVFACGNVRHKPTIPYTKLASMGPHVFACGNEDTCIRSWCGGLASMGPHVFACGNFSFLEGLLETIGASMGPHVFACGNHERHLLASHLWNRLQWGRTFLRAEMLCMLLRRLSFRASMGPHVFACGNLRTPEDGAAGTVLQWGRTFLRAEMRTGSPCPRDGRGFNGAARFCVRKSLGFPAGGRATWVLQWGRTFLRAEMASHLPGTLPDSQLQWGRTFLRAEIAERLQILTDIAKASMGPHVFACGNPCMMLFLRSRK